MSENSSHPFEQDDSFMSDVRFTPDAIDDTIAAYQASSIPRDGPAHLIAALIIAHELPAEAQDALERVRQRVLRAAEVAEVAEVAQVPRADVVGIRPEKEVPDPHRSSHPMSSTQTPNHSKPNHASRSLAPAAAVLIVALLVGGFFALLRLQTPSGHRGSGPSGPYTAFSLPGTLEAPEITSGPDGNLWFYAPRTALFGRVSVSGQVTPVTPFAQGFVISDIVASSDGYLWIADQGNNIIWRLDPHTNAAKSYPLTAANGQLRAIALGPDGAMWATTTIGSNGGDPLIRMDLRTGNVQAYAVPGLTSLSYGLGPIVAAPDGSIWFAPNGNTESPTPGYSRELALTCRVQAGLQRWVT